MTDKHARGRRRCCLYRHFDSEGVLLYVGISQDPNRRTFQHIESSKWVQYAVRMEGVWYDSAAAAEEAEAVAILTENPVFNSHLLKWDVAKARKAEYERTHGPVVLPGKEVRPRPRRDVVAQDIRDMIASGELAAGEQMASIKQLAQQWGIGMDSMIRVFGALLGEGWLKRNRPSGPCFVTIEVPPVPPGEARTAHRRIGHQAAVKKHVRGLIESGELSPGDRVPSLAQLAAALEVSVRSAQHAMEALRAEGLVTTRPGDGTFVARLSALADDDAA